MSVEHELNKQKILKYISQDHYIDPRIIQQDSAFPNQGNALAASLSSQRFSSNSLARGIPQLAPFFSCISNVCRKFKYSIKSSDCWKYYVYPSEERVCSYITDMTNQGLRANLRFPLSEEVTAREKDNIINTSESDTLEWLESTLKSISLSSQRSLNIIKGGTGSGKSSLLKMILNKHRDIFARNGFIPSRVDYTRVSGAFSKAKIFNNTERQSRGKIDYRNGKIPNLPDPYISTMIRIINMCIARDAFIFLIKRQLFGDDSVNQNNVIDYNIESIDFLRKSVKTLIDDGLNNSIIDRNTHKNTVNSFSLEVDRLVGYMITGDDKVFFSIDQKLMKFIVSIACQYGMKFLVILDGFDAISMDEILFGKSQLELLVSIGTIIGDTKSFDYASEFSAQMDIHFIAAIRSNTLAFLLKNISSDHQKINIQHIWTVLPPSVGELLNARVDWLIDTLHQMNIPTTTARENLKSLSFDICRCIVEELGMGDLNLIQISNFDCRKTLEFISDVVMFISDKAKIRRGVGIPAKISVDDFVSIIGFEARHIIREQSYLLIELLLLRKNLSFSNRIAENPDSDSYNFAINGRKFRDQDQMSGIVDNVYNYIAYKSCRETGRSSITLKIRVIQILDAHGALPRERIGTYLRTYFGYQISKEDMTVLLLTMVRTGLLFCDWDANTAGPNGDDRIRYAVHNIAKFLSSGLIFTLAYIEHIFYKTRMPSHLCENSIPCIKYQNMQLWPIASMVNAFIFYNVIRQVETIEEASGQRNPRDTFLGEWQISPRIKKEIHRSADKILSNPSSYIGRKDGSEKVISLMESAMDNWKWD